MATATESRPVRRTWRKVLRDAGDKPQRHAIVLLAAVLALDSADKGAIGAVAPALKDAFHLDNTEIGLLAAAFSLVGIVATIPAGVLTDRMPRTRLLGAAIAIWSVAMLVVGASPDYTFLFVSRLFLGGMIACAGPAIASLTGDMFEPARRGRALGLIESGELIGGGAGFMLAAAVVVVLGWRAVYFVLAVPGFLLAVHMWRMVEPERCATAGAEVELRDELTDVERQVRDADVEPNEDLVLDPHEAETMSTWRAIVWVLRVPTNSIVIIASAIGNFFFSAIRTFAVLFVIDQYGMSRGHAVLYIPAVGIAAVVGTIIGGRTGDAFVHNNNLNGRLYVGIAGYTIAFVALVPAVLTHDVTVALPLILVAGAGIGAASPPLDAARLDIVHPQLWGRAEAVRTVVRTAADAGAPLAFGLLADHVTIAGHSGLQIAFLVTLPTLLANGLVLLLATKHYPRDVATVVASLDR